MPFGKFITDDFADEFFVTSFFPWCNHDYLVQPRRRESDVGAG
jgi:hypothetical protein